MIIKQCPRCGSKVHLYTTFVEEMAIYHCNNIECKEKSETKEHWVSEPIPRHLTDSIQTHKDMEEKWH